MKKIHKKILDNGLTILVYPSHTIPKVAVQLWYGVGSKDEKDGQRGLAHLLEHMIFKGTQILSESDINMIAHKLSGNCNAFTSHDYTGYLFDFPTQNWHHALPLLADCMRNCTFKEDLLNAELKAVIQELKMYKDDYKTSLAEEMLTAIFHAHPYHYPIIGYKQDLWSITRSGLLDFYKQHYVPNNATLIIVGDVQAEQALEHAAQVFAVIPRNARYKKESYAIDADIARKSVTLRRDVQQSTLMYAWVVPGVKDHQQSHIIDMIIWILGEGNGSRLYKKLVNEAMLATELQIDLYELFDANILFLHIDPVDENAHAAIQTIIEQEVSRLGSESVSDEELSRAQKQSQMERLGVFENNQKIAYELGKLFLATGDEQLWFGSNGPDNQAVKDEIKKLCAQYLRPSLMHTGKLLPFEGEQKKQWLALQQESDQLDERILLRKVRESTVECGVFVEEVTINEPANFSYPQASKISLENGLDLLMLARDTSPKIDLVLDFKMRNFYDPESKQGLLNCMMEMLVEGTQKYPDGDIQDVAEQQGVMLTVQTGLISLSMLKEDFQEGLLLLEQLVRYATFPEKSLPKIRQQIAAEIASYWDTPHEFSGQLARSAVYGKAHPYHKNLFGSVGSIQKISREDLVDAYKQYVTPAQASLAVVGDLQGVNVAAAIQKYLGAWQGPRVDDLQYPPLQEVSATRAAVSDQSRSDSAGICGQISKALGSCL